MTPFGPVFDSDLIAQARRPRTFVLRSMILVMFLFAFLSVYWLNQFQHRNFTAGGAAEFGRKFFAVAAGIELTAVLALAPALAAGTIVNERKRGTLQQVLVTDLSNREIVYGAWAGRAFPLLTLIAASFPVLWIARLSGGVSAMEIVRLYAVLVGSGLVLTAFCVFASRWAKRSSDVLILMYTATITWALLPVFQRILMNDKRIFVDADYVSPYSLVHSFPAYRAGTDALTAIAVLVGLSLALVESMSWSIRRPQEPKLRRSTSKAKVRRSREPDIDARPVEWMEWARNRRSIPQTLASVSVFGVCGLSFYQLVHYISSPGSGYTTTPIAGVALGLCGSLFLTAVAVGAQFADDRENRHLEMLGLTMLEEREVLFGRRRPTDPTMRAALFISLLFGLLCIGRSVRMGILSGLINAATYVGFHWMFLASSSHLGLKYRTASAAIGRFAALFLLACLGWPVLVGAACRPGHEALGLMLSQTSPFVTFLFSGLLGLDPEYLRRTIEGGLFVAWSLGVAATAWTAGAIIDASNARLLGMRMRGEP